MGAPDLYQPRPYQQMQMTEEQPPVVTKLIDEAREAMGDWLFLGVFLAGILSLWGGQVSIKKLKKLFHDNANE